MNPTRYELSQRAYDLKHIHGLSFAKIARELGLLDDDGKPQRGRVQRMISDAAAARARDVDGGKIIRDELPNPLLEELAMMRREIAALRSQLNEQEDERLYGHDLGKPWRFEGDAITVGDVHLNTTLMRLFGRLLQVARKHLASPRRLIIAGDIINAEHFGGYPSITPLPPFSQEMRSARDFLLVALTVFDEVDIIPGNHDRRVQKSTNNAISLEDLLRMMSSDSRVRINQWGHCILSTARGDYRITHGSEYSVNQLVVADQLAQKYGQHIISWHEHHCAIGMDRFKKYIIVNGGGLFDQESMAYTQLDDNKKPRMANGFVMVKNGYPHLFSDVFTDWSLWIDEEAQTLRKSA